YGKEITNYIDNAGKKASTQLGKSAPDFAPALDAARHLEQAGAKMLVRQINPSSDTARLNRALCQAERGLLIPQGLPNRQWYRHAIFAPGVYTGYAAVV